MNDTTAFVWVIEAPGQNYLGTREIGHHPEFYWTPDHTKAVRFISSAQADGVMMAVRRMEPKLWAFAANLGEARPVEHGWLRASPISQGEQIAENAKCSDVAGDKVLVEAVTMAAERLSAQGQSTPLSPTEAIHFGKMRDIAADLFAALSSSIQPQGEERS